MLDDSKIARDDLVPEDVDELLKLHGLPWGERLRASADQRSIEPDSQLLLQPWAGDPGQTSKLMAINRVPPPTSSICSSVKSPGDASPVGVASSGPPVP